AALRRRLEGRQERAGGGVAVHAERHRLRAEALGVGVDEGARRGVLGPRIHSGLPGGRAVEPFTRRAQLADHAGELHAEGAEEGLHRDARLRHLADQQQVVPEEGVREEHLGAGVPHARQERREVREAGGEGLEDGDADAGALEGVLLAAGEGRDRAPRDPAARVLLLDGEDDALVNARALQGEGAGDRVDLADDDRFGRTRDRADQEEAAEEDEGASPHPYLITASVLVSKKWMRLGTKASRIFSWGRAFTLGSTRATTDWPARVTSSRISEPRGSTTSTMASNA